MSPLKPLSRSDFRVAIICALSSEFDAVYNVLDRCWDDDERTYQKAAGDTNTYTTGVIGNHNVVVCLSDMGTIQASMAAGSLRLSFPNIDLVLIVGVCGGVPRLPSCSGEIYLGDLVISSQIIEYDFGRQYSDRFERKTSFGNSRSGPVPEIRKFLKTLDTTRRRQQMRDELIRNMRMLREKGIHVAYPGAERDQLYPPEFIHKHRRGICEICDGSTRGCESATRETCGSLGCTDAENITIRYGRTVEPEGQESEHIPNIHIGPIGCGDTVMKSATHRDRIAGRDDIIAFEMEGAGICEQFPSIIIKGVCDYADSHKNKEWQPYAAAISAIGMKALLKQWVLTKVSG
ncbi:zinc finger protein [Nemania abortiva]|nr:zinc finger protein [Nemania abortiva]